VEWTPNENLQREDVSNRGRQEERAHRVLPYQVMKENMNIARPARNKQLGRRQRNARINAPARTAIGAAKLTNVAVVRHLLM
jgi:hypothetical protein